ncbi:RVT_3 domain-containing protein [Gossypium australe]|uniref:RVT_3 domain-containing protein n=1 Tax=Gossypium australe TaxID=47621 RepID=A0A5B6WH06_9ROSI|nr:RVT_3 domain-containing protein [Gossypium australe]
MDDSYSSLIARNKLALKKSSQNYNAKLRESVLYKKGFSQPLLRCLTPSEAEYVILLAQKIFRQGHYWSTVQKDAHELVRTCSSCQRYPQIQQKLAKPLQIMSNP